MADTLQFDLVSPERSLASLEASEVQIPGAEGDFTALPDHAPVITTLRPGVLRVVSGPFRWRVPIADIQSVTPTRSLWSAPALSLDRLRINYGNGRCILVSPADKQGFMEAIGQNEH